MSIIYINLKCLTNYILLCIIAISSVRGTFIWNGFPSDLSQKIYMFIWLLTKKNRLHEIYRVWAVARMDGGDKIHYSECKSQKTITFLNP